jgi:oxygen-dependent protoporphyrinogen oxidase
MDPVAFLRTPLLSSSGKWRLLAEPFLRGGDPGGESVAEFVARRMGRETVDGLVGPFLTGVYAGDEDQLGAEAVFPSLVALERASGSIVRGALATGLRRSLGREPRAERGLRGAWSGPQGLGGFALELAAGLRGGVQLETRAVSLRQEEGGWRVELAGPSGDQVLRASSVILATPSREAAELLRECHPEAARILDGIRYAPVVAVAVGADPREVRRPIEGFGFLVPRAEQLRLLGCLFMSRLFPRRAPEGRELLHCMLGGTRWPEAAETPDDQLAKGIHEDLDRSLGLRSELPILSVRRWPRAVAQPGRSHVGEVASLRRLLATTPGLHLAGSYLDGVSVSDTLASGVRAAEELLSLS